jgi:hypothetical protein
MARALDAPHARSAAGPGASLKSDPADQAWQLLYAAFVIAPIVAGADKFFGLLVNWDQYLAPIFAQMSPVGGHGLMLVIGVVEVIAGLIVFWRPRIGGYLVAVWLWGIILNLLLIPAYFDIALRDFGLSLGALAFARLSERLPARRW